MLGLSSAAIIYLCVICIYACVPVVTSRLRNSEQLNAISNVCDLGFAKTV